MPHNKLEISVGSKLSSALAVGVALVFSVDLALANTDETVIVKGFVAQIL